MAQLIHEGPTALKELLLDELAVDFDRSAAGHLEFTREGGHSEKRIIYAKDATGHAILERVAHRVNSTPRITRRTGWVAIDLLTLSHNSTSAADKYKPLTCFGAYVLDTATGARTQPLIVMITTAGSDRSGICYEQRDYTVKVLQRIEAPDLGVVDETWFGIVYTIDDADALVIAGCAFIWWDRRSKLVNEGV